MPLSDLPDQDYSSTRFLSSIALITVFYKQKYPEAVIPKFEIDFNQLDRSSVYGEQIPSKLCSILAHDNVSTFWDYSTK